jgi:hypothetical protein
VTGFTTVAIPEANLIAVVGPRAAIRAADHGSTGLGMTIGFAGVGEANDVLRRPVARADWAVVHRP